MPRLVWPHEVIGTVTEAAAAETGIPAGTPVSPGTVDAWAEAFSAGVRQPGDLMLMYGSTMFFVEVLESFRVQPKLWTTAGVEPGHVHAGRGHVDERLAHHLDPGAHRRGAVRGPGPRGERDRPRLGRADRAAVLRRRADPDLRSAGPRRDRRAHPAAPARAPVPGGLRGHRVRHPADRRVPGGRASNPVTPADRGRWWHQGRAVDARSSATSPGGRRRSRSRPSGPATATRCWPRSAPAWCRRRPTGPGSDGGSSRTPARHECYEQLFDTYSALYPATREHVHFLARMQEAAFPD